MAGQHVVDDPSRHGSPLGQVAHGSRLRFVASDAVGLPVKRKQVQHACLACRQKKKKCNHGPAAIGASLSPDSHAHVKRLRHGTPSRPQSSPTGRSSTSIDIDEDASTAASHLLELSDRAGGGGSADSQEEDDPQARFVGDMNPENILISAMAEVSGNSQSSHQQRDSAVGLWKEPVPHQEKSGGNGTRKPLPAGAARDRPVLLASGARAAYDNEMASLEESMRTARNIWLEKCLVDIHPPPHAFDKLRSIYIKKIQPIFPVFDEKQLMNLGTTSRIDRAIRLVISLAAATDGEAKPHLFLEAYPGTLLSFPEFTSKVSQLLRAIFQDLDCSRLLDQIRIQVLMALYWQPLEEQEWDHPARLFSQAMTTVFSIGLHLEVYDKANHEHDHPPDETQTHTPASVNTQQQRGRAEIERLFLCIWAVDRMLASFYGRPILLNERDFDRNILMYATRQPPIFRLFILVIWQLNLIQDLYRPFSGTAPSVESAEVSVFERLILESGAEHAPPSVIATIEVLHHAVCALSVRQTRQAFENPPLTGPDKQPEFPHLPHPLLNARRSISADRILQITKQYDVAPFPFIPYALSISLSVAYRKWRFSQIPMFRLRGRASFMEVLPVLEKWGCVFTSARINYTLAQKVVEGMEKVQDNIKRKCREGTPVRDQLMNVMAAGVNGAGVGASSNAPAGGQSNGSIASEAIHLRTAGNSSSYPANDHPSSSSATLHNGDTPLAFPAPDPRAALPFNYDFSTAGGSSFPDDLAGLNLFNFFDESTTNLDVGLGEMDTLFDRNLDPMAPAFWPAYPSLDPERIDAGAAFFP